jgi:predicted Zn-dependent protease
MSYHSPQSSKNTDSSNRQLLIAAGLIVGTFIVGIWLLLSIVGRLIYFIPPQVEQNIGKLIVPVYEQQAAEGEVQDSLNKLLDRLETNLPQETQQARDYRILYISDDTVNALAIPGDRVIIYQGLLAKVESENELMMVLGHELGHFAHRDHLRGIGNALVLRMVVASLFGDLGIFQPAANSVRALADASYSQKQEKQADEFGLTLLDRTYGHVAGATDFFAKLSKEKKRSISFLSSHPASKTRVRELQKLIKQNRYQLKDKSPLPEVLTVDLNNRVK